jgi:phosphohistidine phosphatase
LRLIFFRHGRAEKHNPAGDEARRLTEEGVRDVEASASLLPFKPARIVSSPLVRARQTAEIVARVSGVGSFHVDDRLRPDSPSGVEALQSMGVSGGWVLVGHNPWLEETVEELVGGRVKLSAGGFALVYVEALKPGGGFLEALVSPEVARRCRG